MKTKLSTIVDGNGDILVEGSKRGIAESFLKILVCWVIGHPTPKPHYGLIGFQQCPRCWEWCQVNNVTWR